ncbi:MAG: hypothetical protein AB7N91_22685 [Candidatus Tectimicrobiota bacterium]
MEETTRESSSPSSTVPAAPRLGTTPTRSRRAPRPARPRAETTLSAAILTDRGLADGYVALPLARLMASRVWTSVETLNQQLTLLEHHSFTRMTSDPTFEAQGKALQQLLRAYAVLTTQLADLAQRLAQNRLIEADRLALATGHLSLLLPRLPAPDPVLEAVPTVVVEEYPQSRAEEASDMAVAPACPEIPSALPRPPDGSLSEEA